MDEGPFKMPRSAPSRPERRSEPTPTTSRQAAVAPAPTTERATRPTSDAKRPSRWPSLVIIVLLVIGLGMAVFAWLKQDQSVGNFIQDDTYQAVFSANGQVYFGKLDAASGDELRLTDVYYVQASATGDDAEQTSNSNDLELIKLGSNEVYGPQNEMVFIKDQVLYYENLDPDGKVSNLIRDNKGN